MNKWIVLGLLVIAATATTFEEEENVLVLKDSDFDEAIKQYEFILVEFYAPWCGHCKKLAPEFSKAAATLKNSEKPVPLAKVDATVQTKVAERFSIQGFPTIKFFVNGEPIEYNGGRTDKEIVNWIQKRVGQVSTPLADQTAFDNFVKDNQVAVVYFGASESDENWNVFKSLAMSEDKLSFAHSFNDEVIANQRTQRGKIVVFKKFDEGRNDYEGAYTFNDVKKWLDEKSFPTVIPFDDRAIEKIFQQGNPTLFLFHTNSDESKSAYEIFQAAAKELRGNKVLFSHSHPDDGFGHFQRLAEYVGVNTANVPSLMLVHTSSEVNKYKYTGEITQENIKDFVQRFNAGSLEKYYKTEEIPANNNGPVKVLVGKNWQDEVINNNKDVLVKFYAPWCGHCKSLAPKWDKAAELLAGNPNIVIAKIDSTLNEVPGVNIRGFPTLKFYPGNNKKSPVEYEGDRTEEGIIKFLKEKTTHPWVEPKTDL